MVHNGKSSDDPWHSTFTPQTQWASKSTRRVASLRAFYFGTDGNLHRIYLGAAKRGHTDPKDLWYSQFNGSRWTRPGKIPKQFSKAPPTLLGGAGTTSRLRPLLVVHLEKSADTLWHALYGKNPRLPAATQRIRWHANEKLLGKTSDGPSAWAFSKAASIWCTKSALNSCIPRIRLMKSIKDFSYVLKLFAMQLLGGRA